MKRHLHINAATATITAVLLALPALSLAQVETPADEDPLNERQREQFRLEDDDSYQGQYMGCSCDELIGATVRSPQGQRLGKLEEITVDRDSGRIAYAVVSSGGFLNIGEKLLAVPWHSFQAKPDCSVQLNATKASLESADGFDEDNWPNAAREVWDRSAGDGQYRDRAASDAGAISSTIRLSQLEGKRVTNYRDQQIGEMADIVVDTAHGHVAYAVIAPASTLNVRRDFVVIPWNALHVRSPDEMRIGTSETTLAEAPGYSSNSRPRPSDKSFVLGVFNYYKTTPYWVGYERSQPDRDESDLDRTDRRTGSNPRESDRDRP